MSKIKTNPSAIKNYIAAVKHSELSDTKKDGIIKVLQQYTWDKQDGILTDGMVCQLLFDICMELQYHTEEMSNNEIITKLLDIIHNIDQRVYWNEENGFGERLSNKKY